MAKHETSFVPNRIDRDPPVILGVTSPEVNAIGWLSIPAFIITAILVYSLFGSIVYAIFGGVVGIAISLFGGLMLLVSIKRNKPPHYILHKKHILLDKLGLKPAPFVYKSERFSATDDL